MNATSVDLVARLWNLCSVLREDGVTYHQYVTELTYLLFLKMAKEAEREDEIPTGCRWDDLVAESEPRKLAAYRRILVQLGRQGSNRVKSIYEGAATALRRPHTVAALLNAIEGIEWWRDTTRGGDASSAFGDIYEGLLEKNATEVKSGAGQYFTPRPLVETIVALTKPQRAEVIQDPACGTAGFLVAAHEHIKSQDRRVQKSHRVRGAGGKGGLYGIEIVPETRRLALMNLALHDVDATIFLGDALSSLGAELPPADVILTNPPFGARRGSGLPTRDDFQYPTSNKQIAFLEHVYRGLKIGGRAAVIVPDNVLFEDGVGGELRRELLDHANLHTVLRLPTGIFYAQGVKTNVLFFSRPKKGPQHTEAVWYYDLRTNLQAFGRRSPLTREHFAEFERLFGSSPTGDSVRVPTGERWRKFGRDEIRARQDNLDIVWMRDEAVRVTDDEATPEVIAGEIRQKLKFAIDEIDSLLSILAEAGE